jgi:hypothetical protein
MATIDEFVLKKILVFDESTESVDIATNEKILLLGEYSKVKIPYYSRGIEGEKRTHPRFVDWSVNMTVLVPTLWIISIYIGSTHAI